MLLANICKNTTKNNSLHNQQAFPNQHNFSTLMAAQTKLENFKLIFALIFNSLSLPLSVCAHLGKSECIRPEKLIASISKTNIEREAQNRRHRGQSELCVWSVWRRPARFESSLKETALPFYALLYLWLQLLLFYYLQTPALLCSCVCAANTHAQSIASLVATGFSLSLGKYIFMLQK